MKDHNATMQLAFVTIIILVVCAVGWFGLGWMNENFGEGGALGMFFVLFVTVVIFIQQYLSGQQIHNILASIVEYSAGDAKVDAYRQQVNLEVMKTSRGILTLDAKQQVDQNKLLEQRAQALASVLSAAQVKEMRAKMMGVGPQDDGEEAMLD